MPVDIPDVVNGLFEGLGTFAVLVNFRRVLKDKCVAGVSIPAVVFFMSWGLWNLFYYPHLGQWWSFWGGVGIVTANCCWIGGMVYYKRNPQRRRDDG